VASSSLCDRPQNEYDIDSGRTDKLQRANQTELIVNTYNSDEAPLSIAESSGQILAPTTVSASSLPDLGDDGPVVVDISNFTAAKILNKRPSPFGFEYRCELEPLWLTADFMEKAKMGRVQEWSHTGKPSRDVEGKKEEAFTNVSALSRPQHNFYDITIFVACN